MLGLVDNIYECGSHYLYSINNGHDTRLLKDVNNNYCGGVARAANTVKDGVSQLTWIQR